MGQWNIEQSRKLYNVEHWSSGYFDINARGRLVARPGRSGGHGGVDLYELAQEIRDLGMSLPVLVRVTDILEDRVGRLYGAFERACREHDFQGRYTAVYPIKVNQQRTVVEHLQGPKQDRIGLEAGSKPELMAVLARAVGDSIIICNGYKDSEYIRLALIGRRLGHRTYLVVEKIGELELILREAEAMGVDPLIGMRVRLASIGKGKWQNTGGEKSKFGLSAGQALAVVDKLRDTGKLDWLQLIHCHLGSQLANIRDIQLGMNEVARFYAELRALDAPISHVDVGGGLGVDYEGSRSRNFCSMNYSVQEYANDVIHALWRVCTEHNLPHPDVITESGRAMSAHHALLITNVIDMDQAPREDALKEPPAGAPLVLHSLWQTFESLSSRSALEAYHDAVHWLAEAQTMFNHGVLSLAQRAQAEQLYYTICRRVRPLLELRHRAHREVLDELNDKLADKYFCNLSIFQSMPDIWAIEQIFPIVPLHKLDEEPTRRAVLQDLTCDSDGVIHHYVDHESIESTLAVHEYTPGEPYLLGIFMVGAYQEILGDLHNLFGDTHSINLEFTADGGHRLVEAEQGDTVAEILSYVHFDPDDLLARYREKIDRAGLGDEGEGYFTELQAGLTGYSYLED